MGVSVEHSPMIVNGTKSPLPIGYELGHRPFTEFLSNRQQFLRLTEAVEIRGTLLRPSGMEPSKTLINSAFPRFAESSTAYNLEKKVNNNDEKHPVD
jgi:hypothetical protein